MKFWPIGCKDFLPRYNLFIQPWKPHTKKPIAVFTAWLDTCTLWVFFKSESEEEVVVRLSWYTKINLISTSSNKRPIYLRNSHWLVSVHFSVFGFFPSMEHLGDVDHLIKGCYQASWFSERNQTKEQCTKTLLMHLVTVKSDGKTQTSVFVL